MVKHAAEDADCEDAPEDPGAARLEEAIAVRRADAAPRQIQQKSEKANKRGPPRRGGARRRRNQRKNAYLMAVLNVDLCPKFFVTVRALFPKGVWMTLSWIL